MYRAFVVQPEILFEPTIGQWTDPESVEKLIGKVGVCKSPPIETPIGDISIFYVPGHNESLNVFASIISDVGQWSAGCVHGTIAVIGRHQDLSDDDLVELRSLHSYIQDSMLQSALEE